MPLTDWRAGQNEPLHSKAAIKDVHGVFAQALFRYNSGPENLLTDQCDAMCRVADFTEG